MLEITVDGNLLTIPDETELILEQKNNALDLDNITADIIWSFDIPATPNARIFDNAQYVYISNNKKYSCFVSIDGVPISKGQLYIQNATEKKFTCGVLLNKLDDGFGKMLLSENTWPQDITIATSAETHREDWLRFLRQSLTPTSRIKFFLFKSEQFYKDNPAYGFHRNIESALGNSPRNKESKYINRLFFNENDNVINLPDTTNQGVRVFNTASGVDKKDNGYAFAPAISLEFIIRQIFKSCNLSVTGEFIEDDRIKNLFVQSMNALDGDLTQYELMPYVTVNNAILENRENTPPNPINIYKDGDFYNSFKRDKLLTPIVAFRLLLPTDELLINQTVTLEQNSWNDDPYNCRLFTKYDEVYMLAIKANDQEYPKYRAFSRNDGDIQYHAYGELATYEDVKWTGNNVHHIITQCKLGDDGRAEFTYKSDAIAGISLFPKVQKKPIITTTQNTAKLVQLTNSTSYETHWINANIGSYTEGTYPIYESLFFLDRSYSIQLLKCKIYTFDGCSSEIFFSGNMEGSTPLVSTKFGQLERLRDYTLVDMATIDYHDTPLNIFSKVLRWSEHVPAISNSEFITNVCKFFGLNVFVNSMTQEVQFSYFANTFKAKEIDLSKYLTNQKKLSYNPKRYKCSIDSCLGNRQINEKFKLDDINRRDKLLLARSFKNKSTFIENENAYNKSIKEENSINWIWETSSGNDHTFVVGDVDEREQQVCPSIKIPNMRWCDKKDHPKYLCEIAASGCSSLLDEDYSGKFGFIIQQYRGRRLVKLQSNGPISQAYIEYANPTIYNEDDTKDTTKLNLTATGENSVGQMYQKPLYDFLAQHELFSFSFKVPVGIFLEIYSLLQPQIKVANEQRRFIMVDNRKYLPVKISYTFKSSNSIDVVIECARKHVPV